MAAPAVPVEAPRRRHAADVAPPTHPDARPPVGPPRRRPAADVAPPPPPAARPPVRGRALRRVLAAAALVVIAVAPVLDRSTSALGLHDAVAAELAAHPDQAEDTLDALGR